jgi:LmbE family N-acetylglucosaminyl deacetylase
MNNVVVFAAHPDDEVLGVGGTIPLIKRKGGKVTVVIVTDGSTVQYADDPAAVQRKQAQAIRANEILGTDDLQFWDLPDMSLDTVPSVDLNSRIGTLLKEGRFDAVFVHSETDINLDHRLIHEAVLVSTRPYPGQNVKQVFSYYVSSSTEWGARSSRYLFHPNFFVDIENTIEIKLQAMGEYVDELRAYPHPRSIEALRARARVHGNEVGYAFSEPFRLILAHGDVL